MSKWLDSFDTAAGRAGQEAGLPGPVVRGLDGARWVWLWRGAIEGDGRMAEAGVGVRPDRLRGLEAEVWASAWLVERPEILQVERYPAREVEALLSTTQTSDVVDRLSAILHDLLSRAWREAERAARDLDERAASKFDRRVEKLSQRLRDQGLG